jgi:hypothetical protein
MVDLGVLLLNRLPDALKSPVLRFTAGMKSVAR